MYGSHHLMSFACVCRLEFLGLHLAVATWPNVRTGRPWAHAMAPAVIPLWGVGGKGQVTAADFGGCAVGLALVDWVSTSTCSSWARSICIYVYMNIAIMISIDIMYIHILYLYHMYISESDVQMCQTTGPFFVKSPRAVSWTGLTIPQEAAGGWLSGHHHSWLAHGWSDMAMAGDDEKSWYWVQKLLLIMIVIVIYCYLLDG